MSSVGGSSRSRSVIEDIYLNPSYWILFVGLLGVGYAVSRVKPLDFAFVGLAYLAQFVAHSLFAFGIASQLFWFCTAFFAFFIATLNPRLSPFRSDSLTGRRVSSRVRTRLASIRDRIREPDEVWILLAKIYLIIYSALRLSTYPWLGGALDIAARLDASQENRLVFFLGLALLPAIAAASTQWLRRAYRFGVIDALAIVGVILALAVSGSKATLLPAVLTIVGAAYFTRRPLRSGRVLGVLASVALVLGVVGYAVAVGASRLTSAFDALLYRVAANTDSLAYLLALDQAPSNYPFAGFGALVPSLFKRLGYTYDYSPGVWLQGSLYGQWEGYGPNPGIVMDYFANLGWLGVLAAIFVALYFLASRWLGGAIGAAFGSITYLAFVDITLFESAFALWVAVLIVLMALWFGSRRSRRLSNARQALTGYLARGPRWLFGHSPEH